MDPLSYILLATLTALSLFFLLGKNTTLSPNTYQVLEVGYCRANVLFSGFVNKVLGLTSHAYVYKYKMPAVTSDVVVLNHDKTSVLMIKRSEKTEPKEYANTYAIPGGHLDVEKETVEHCAVRELREETGLDLDQERLTLVSVQSKPDRDPRQHTITTVYKVVLNEDEESITMDRVEDKDEVSELKWVSLEIALNSKLAFDHNDSLKKALE